MLFIPPMLLIVQKLYNEMVKVQGPCLTLKTPSVLVCEANLVPDTLNKGVLQNIN